MSPSLIRWYFHRDAHVQAWHKWRDAEFDLRHLMVRRVNQGDLSIAEAEERMRREGYGPLQRLPEPGKINVLQMPEWTLPMVLAWIVWRSPADVARFSPEAAVGRMRWVGRDLQIFGRPTIHDVTACMATAAAEGTLSAPEAPLLTTLWGALSRSELAARGQNAANAGVDIPAAEWPYLRMGSESEALYRDGDGESPTYRNLIFTSESVLLAWRPNTPAEQVAKRRAGRIAQQTQCDLWLREIIKASPHHATMKNLEILAFAKEHWPALTKTNVIGHKSKGDPGAKGRAMDAVPGSRAAWARAPL